MRAQQRRTNVVMSSKALRRAHSSSMVFRRRVLRARVDGRAIGHPPAGTPGTGQSVERRPEQVRPRQRAAAVVASSRCDRGALRAGHRLSRDRSCGIEPGIGLSLRLRASAIAHALASAAGGTEASQVQPQNEALQQTRSALTPTAAALAAYPRCSPDLPGHDLGNWPG